MSNRTSRLEEDRIVSLEDYVEAFSIYKNFLAGLSENESDKAEESPKVRAAKEKFFEIKDVFTREHGEILNRYICGYSNSAAMICLKKKKNFYSRDTVRFFSQYELGTSPEIESLLIEIDFLAAESTRLLRGKSLNRCLGLIYKVAKNSLVLLDSVNKSQGVAYNKTGNPASLDLYGAGIKGMPKVSTRSVDAPAPEADDLKKTVAVVEKNLRNARSYHERAAKLTAQMDYFMGNILGFVGIIAILAILALINGFSFFELESVSGANGQPANYKVATLLYFGITAGCIGAIISVMNRISSGNLELNHEPDSQTIRIIGLIRPFIGGVFGGLLLVLLNSGLSIFNLNDVDMNKSISNFIVLGFIAGFFERFVPDILDKTKGKLSEGEATEPAVHPAVSS